MSCERYDSALRDCACGGAPIDADAAAHLEVCAPCRERVDAERRLLRDVEEQLQLLLQVQPSTGFEPRVMAHVAHSASRRRRALWWSLGAAAAVFMLASVGSLRFGVASRDDRPAGRQALAVAPTRSASVAVDTPSATIESRPRPPEVSTSTRSRRPAVRPLDGAERTHAVDGAFVLVPPGRAEALDRYLALLRRGTVDTTVLARSEAAAAGPADLTIPPLSIELLAVEDVDTDPGPAPGGLDSAPNEEGVK